jgi:hypothetical protein
MTHYLNRRDAIAVGFSSFASLALPGGAEGDSVQRLVRAHDEALENMLEQQVTEAGSRWCGGVPDVWGLHHARHAALLLRDAAAAYFHSESRYHGSRNLYGRMKLAAQFLERAQHDSGNIDLLVVNFNSPPDTGFVVHKVASAAKLAQMHGDREMLSLMEAFIRRAGAGMAKGGIHTPNHRWVVCAALAQINELFPDRRYVKRIDQWLAEGIDIDEEGQYTERSTAGYNATVDDALVVMAKKLNRPELFEPVRKNLDAMAYLLHANGEVVTVISRRQDQNRRGTMGRYWFSLRSMAIEDKNGLYAAMLKPLEPQHAELARLMEYPELLADPPPETPIPEHYEKEYPRSRITRIRHGKTSATIMHKGYSRWISIHHGEAVVNAVRFASAFFGEGQFKPTSYEKRGNAFHFRQRKLGVYFQPIDNPEFLPVSQETWGMRKVRRERSETCRLTHEGRIAWTGRGFEISIRAYGTDGVPLAVEINLRDGGKLVGVEAVPHVAEAFLLKEGFAEYSMGSDAIRFGPGQCEHAYVQVRGALEKLSGPSVYLTGYTPFQHTLVVELL